ncbi:hypothetical protein [uncultured Gammaproteobacteria bacterium]|jgi:hypothetical protein|nr:hypothetical protein BROOK1789B_747 [Bathymodiolus brooksi thiotrophic gill symbiont]CAC9561406.1 hypothetical protein [uncultured Gammaproteobacteria bacterium]CAB9544972.1 hypothetical protein BROOK1789C_2084 [Bathymodiolus brooksi thiotrophic gill symbiont]CAC9565862.1 hypothetical protein [uncultured Gammaproteobacteria bacterium]CAC9602071.1 hypothetical protein [uncultured Gammaproteobacteria bacterium]
MIKKTLAFTWILFLMELGKRFFLAGSKLDKSKNGIEAS